MGGRGGLGRILKVLFTRLSIFIPPSALLSLTCLASAVHASTVRLLRGALMKTGTPIRTKEACKYR